MPYQYLEDIGNADIAFEATGRDLPELFSEAADATMNVMIDNLGAIEPHDTRQIELSNDKIDMLLFDFLQELIYLKDADRLLLRVRDAQIDKKEGKYFLKAGAALRHFGSSATKPLRPSLQTRIKIFSFGFNFLLMATKSFAFLTGCLFTS